MPLSALLGVRRRVSGARRLDLPADFSLLRDVVIECLGRRHSGARLQSLAAWASQVADSPSLALRFASAAFGRHISAPEAPDAELFAAGLAATIGWLLRAVDVRVAHWALARALPAKYPAQLVSTEAAVLGEDAALLRAFEAGLIEGLADEAGDMLDLRRPLHLLGHLDEAPLDIDFALVARELHAALTPEVYVVVERHLRSAPKRLGLGGPDRPRAFVGRADVLKRLVALFEPANEVRTTVLYGVDGSGRSAVAAALFEQGEADALLRKLDGNPRAIVTAASLLGAKSLGEVEALVGAGEESISGLLRSSVAALDPEETRLARALALCAPMGSPKELPLRIADVKEGVLARLEDKALVVTTQGKVRLHGLARIETLRELREEEQRRLEKEHAQAAYELFRQARVRHEQKAEDEIYGDTLLALEHMTALCRAMVLSSAELVIKLANHLNDYPRDNYTERLRHVIAGCQAVLAIVTMDSSGILWAVAQYAMGAALALPSQGAQQK